MKSAVAVGYLPIVVSRSRATDGIAKGPTNNYMHCQVMAVLDQHSKAGSSLSPAAASAEPPVLMPVLMSC